MATADPSRHGIWLLGGKLFRYALGFPLVFILGWLAQVLSGNAAVSHWGLEYVIFALLLGLFVSNILGVPDWLREEEQRDRQVLSECAESVWKPGWPNCSRWRKDGRP